MRDLTSTAKTSPGPAVLLLGNYRPTITLARVLSREGYRVISGSEGCDGGAEHCRHVAEIWDHASVRENPKGFLTELRAFLEARPEISIVYPVSEEFVRLFAQTPDALPSKPIIVMAKPESVLTCLDKIELMKRAISEAVPTAPFALVSTLSEFHQAVGKIKLPLVIRPEYSTDRIGGKKALVCETQADIDAVVSEIGSRMPSLLLQAKAEGRRHNLYFAAQNGKIVRYLHAVILRTDMPDGTGLATEGITVSPDQNLKACSERLIKSLGYTGVGCVQFLVDDASGSVSFLEINPRIAGNHAVPEAAGLELSTLAIELARAPDREVDVIEGKPGLRYVWTCGDIVGCKAAFMSGAVSKAEAAGWAVTILKAAILADVHMKWSWRDPLPGVMSLLATIPSPRGLLRSLGRVFEAKHRIGTALERHTP